MELIEAETAESGELYYVDVEFCETPEYCSVYILDAERPAVIDTGTGRNYEWILDGLDELGIAPEELEVIAPTHAHLDHAGGAGYLADACPNADIYLYESAVQFLVDPDRLWEGTKQVLGDRIRFYAEPEPIPEDRIVELEDGDEIDLGDHVLDVHHAPGHAFHQAIFHDRADDGIFAADAAGINVPGLDGVRQSSPPPGFDLEGCLDDVELLESLDPAALYYGHFGDRETDGLLEAYADVIESWVDAIERKRAELEDDEAVIEYFVERAETEELWGSEHARGEEAMNVEGVLHYLDSRE